MRPVFRQAHRLVGPDRAGRKSITQAAYRRRDQAPALMMEIDASPRAAPSSLPTWASTRCGAPVHPLRRAAPLAHRRRSAPWLRLPAPSGRSSRIPASWSSPWSAMAASRCHPQLCTISTRPSVKIVISNNGYLGMVRQWQSFSITTHCAVELEGFPDIENWPALWDKGRTSERPEDWRSRRPFASRRSCSTSGFRSTKTSTDGSGGPPSTKCSGPPQPVAVPK